MSEFKFDIGTRVSHDVFGFGEIETDGAIALSVSFSSESERIIFHKESSAATNVRRTSELTICRMQDFKGVPTVMLGDGRTSIGAVFGLGWSGVCFGARNGCGGDDIAADLTTQPFDAMHAAFCSTSVESLWVVREYLDQAISQLECQVHDS